MDTNRLTRDTEHAMLGGVCAGIANRVNLDPTIVRVAAIALGLLTAVVPLVVIYVALWLIMPAAEAPPHRPTRDELTSELRDAADRVQEAAKIVTAAARQAADEISQVQGRRRTETAASAPNATAPDATSPDAPEGGPIVVETPPPPTSESPSSAAPATWSAAAAPEQVPPAPLPGVPTPEQRSDEQPEHQQGQQQQ